MTERTLVLIKPDGVERGLVGEVVGRIERKGFRIVAMELRTLPREVAEAHYGEHAGKPFRSDVAYLATSGFVVPRRVLARTGGFDEFYDPTCFEDTDLSFQVKAAGWRIPGAPDAKETRRLVLTGACVRNREHFAGGFDGAGSRSRIGGNRFNRRIVAEGESPCPQVVVLC